MGRFYGSKKFRQLQRRSGFKNFLSSKMELFVTMTQKKVAVVLKCFCTNVAGPLDLPMYKFKTDETLKVP